MKSSWFYNRENQEVFHDFFALFLQRKCVSRKKVEMGMLLQSLFHISDPKLSHPEA